MTSEIGADSLTVKQRLQLKKGYIAFVGQFQPTHTVTFNFGPWVSCDFAHYCMKGYCGRIERIALGRKYYRFQGDRLAVLGFPEHLDKNPHWHCVVRAPGFLATAIEEHSISIWGELVPAGQLHWSHPRRLRAIQVYFTKEASVDGRWDAIFLYASGTDHLFVQC